MNWEEAYKQLVKKIETLLRNGYAAEGTALHHYAACKTSYDAAVQDKNKYRLQIAKTALEEAIKTKEANWNILALLEYLAKGTIDTEKRLRLPPTVISWIEKQD